MKEDHYSHGLQERMVDWLSMVVPLKIAEMAESCYEGPSDRDWERLGQCVEKWWTGGKVEGTERQYHIMADAWIAGIDADTTKRERAEITEMRLDIAHALSVMAWCPGGVKIFGVHIHAPICWGVREQAEREIDALDPLSYPLWQAGDAEQLAALQGLEKRYQEKTNVRLAGWANTYPFGWFVRGEIPFETICEVAVRG